MQPERARHRVRRFRAGCDELRTRRPRGAGALRTDAGCLRNFGCREPAYSSSADFGQREHRADAARGVTAGEARGQFGAQQRRAGTQFLEIADVPLVAASRRGDRRRRAPLRVPIRARRAIPRWSVIPAPRNDDADDLGRAAVAPEEEAARARPGRRYRGRPRREACRRPTDGASRGAASRDFRMVWRRGRAAIGLAIRARARESLRAIRRFGR